MVKSSTKILAALVLAVALQTPAKAAYVEAPAAGGGAGLIMLPIACTFILPFIKSAKLRRELTGPEISATTLMCFTGPLGYHIATKKGWIGPDFFRHPARR